MAQVGEKFEPTGKDKEFFDDLGRRSEELLSDNEEDYQARYNELKRIYIKKQREIDHDTNSKEFKVAFLGEMNTSGYFQEILTGEPIPAEERATQDFLREMGIDEAELPKDEIEVSYKKEKIEVPEDIAKEDIQEYLDSYGDLRFFYRQIFEKYLGETDSPSFMADLREVMPSIRIDDAYTSPIKTRATEDFFKEIGYEDKSQLEFDVSDEDRVFLAELSGKSQELLRDYSDYYHDSMWEDYNELAHIYSGKEDSPEFQKKVEDLLEKYKKQLGKEDLQLSERKAILDFLRIFTREERENT
ncbi:MAG: hypothetical protein WCP14_00795 [bacterium]